MEVRRFSTVGELIEVLRDYPSDLPVASEVICEGGPSLATSVEVVSVVPFEAHLCDFLHLDDPLVALRPDRVRGPIETVLLLR